MNKDNAAQFLPLVKALAEGKTLQFLSSCNVWEDRKEVSFTYPHERYRIKPEPRVVYSVWNKGGEYLLSYGQEDEAVEVAAIYRGTYTRMVEEL